MPDSSIPDDLPAPLTTRNLLPRSRATSLSLSAVASRSHSPSASSFSPYLSMQPQDTDIESQLGSFPRISMDYPNAWGSQFNNMPSTSSMNHHIPSSYPSFENNDPFPQRRGKKQLFVDDPMTAGPSQQGPSSQPFCNQSQPPDPNSPYGLESRTTISGLKRKREDSLEPSWLDDQHPPHSMSIPMELDDDLGPGPSYTSRDRKGKGKEIDYKGKGKQREKNPEDSPILISDSPISSNFKPLATTTRTLVPSKPPSEPLSGYLCPICFSAPTNATLTPCGHISCGECLFTAVKTIMHRAQQAGAPDAQHAICPVCRAVIPDWDGKGAGVIGLKARAIFSL